MSVYRVNKDRGYFYASNEPFNDKRLSWEARGVMGYLLSKPDGWECRNYDLENQTKAGQHVIKRVMKELQEAGYIYRQRVSDGRNGIRWVTEIYESPSLNPHLSMGDFSTVENFKIEKFIDEKPHDIINTDSANTDFNKELTTTCETETLTDAEPTNSRCCPDKNNKTETVLDDNMGLYTERHADYGLLCNHYKQNISPTLSAYIGDQLDDLLTGHYRDAKGKHPELIGVAWPLDRLKEAIEIAVTYEKRNLAYILGVLGNWVKDGYQAKKQDEVIRL